MSASDHRRQGDRRARARRGGRARSSCSSSSTAARPGWRRCSSATIPASAVYVGGKQRACAEVGMAPFDRRLAADASFEEVAEELERLNGDRAVSGVLLQLPLPEHLDGPALTGDDRRRQGRRRPHAGQRRAAVARAPRPAAVHAARGDGAAGRHRRRSWRAPKRSSSGARTCSASRWRSCCSRANATVTDLPLAHARPARGVRPRGGPDRRGRAPAAWSSATSSSRAPS